MPERKNARVTALTTKIVVDSVDTDHPYCTWPSPHGLMHESAESPARTLFAVQTWDGRELIAVDVTRSLNE